MKKYFVKNSITAIITFLFLGYTSSELFAQQEVLTTQWAYNKLTVNPAYAGGKDLLSTRVLHRQQWVGLDGRPMTTVLNAHSPLLQDRMALGLSYVHDKLGLENSHTLLFSYAYRLPFENDSKLSFGINAGLEAHRLNVEDLELVEPGDPIESVDMSKTSFISGAGIYYYGSNYYIGVSVPNFIPNKLFKDVDGPGEESRQYSHIYAMAGYAINTAGGDFVIKPQVFFKGSVSKDIKAPWQIDFNLSFILFERVVLGSTFRTTFGNENVVELENSASADLMVGAYVAKGLLISYAYDFTLGELKSYDSGSHEILLGFDIDPKRKGSHSPRYF